MTYQKGFSPIVVVLSVIVVLSLIAGAYYLGIQKINTRPAAVDGNPTQTTQPTSNPSQNQLLNWKTYSNSSVGFEIKYPAGYSAPVLPTGPIGPNPEATDKETDAALIFCKTPSDCFELRILPFEGTLDALIETPNGLTPYSWKNTEDVKVSVVKELEIDGIKAKWLKASYIKTSYSDSYEAIFFVNKGYGFIFNTFSTLDKEILNTILSSIKFTD